jgi:hypothetical protein
VRLLRLVLPGFLLIGVSQLLVAAAMAGHTAWELSRLMPAEARVVSVVTVPALRASSPTYAPILAFTTADGREVRARPGYSSSVRPAAGEVWPIRYDPASPQRIRTLGFVETWLGATVTGAMGVVWLAFTWLAWRIFGRLLRSAATIRA